MLTLKVNSYLHTNFLKAVDENPDSHAQELTPLLQQNSRNNIPCCLSMFDESDNAKILLKLLLPWQGTKPRLDHILGYGADLISKCK